MYELSLYDKRKMEAAVKDAAEYFINGVSLELIKGYAQKLGYLMVFFYGRYDPILARMGLCHKSNAKAFACRTSDKTRILFVNAENDEETSLFSALAVLGAIALGHLGTEIHIEHTNAERREMEQGAFAYKVLERVSRS